MNTTSPVNPPFTNDSEELSVKPLRKKPLFHFPKKLNSKILLVAALGVLMLGTVASLYLIDRAQDLRQSASVQGGIVEVTSMTSGTGTAVTVGQPATISLLINTKNAQVDGVQLAFNVITEVTDSIEIKAEPESGLSLVAQQVTPNSAGFSVEAILIGPIPNSFSSSQAKKFLNIEFTPTQTGNIQFVYDQTKSISTISKSNPVKDELATVPTMNFTVQSGGTTTTATNTPTPLAATNTPTSAPITITSTPSPWITPTPSGVFDPGQGGTSSTPTPTFSVSPTATLTNTPTLTPTTTVTGTVTTTTVTATATLAPGTTATSTPVPKACNETCSVNAQCQSQYICFAGRCRNPNNTASTSCAAAAGNVTNTSTPTQTVTPNATPSLPAAGGTGNILIMTGVGVTVLLLGALAVFLLL